MKSEPDCYSIDHLKASSPAMWEGCRNYTVRNFFRDRFQVGDLAFFHNSNCDPAGVVGVMRVASPAYPDPTQFDPASRYHDPKAPADGSRWLVVDMEYVEHLPRLVSMAEMRAEPRLAGMAVLQRGQRLSVLPVKPEEWSVVTEISRRDPE